LLTKFWVMKKIILFVFISLTFNATIAQCWRSVSAGGGHTIAIANNGTLWSWGQNSNGQLGNGTTSFMLQYTPIQVGTSNNWAFISAGNGHNVAIKTDGTLWAWGRNVDGQIGNGTASATSVNSPTQIGTGNAWAYVACGDEFTLALKSDNTLWAWGDNLYGQIGNGASGLSADVTSPTQIGGSDWKSISAGTFHAVAIKNNNTLWAWGRNQFGQLGNNSIVDLYVPTAIGTDNDWESVSAAVTHTIATKNSGSLWTWGSNQFGQLGDNSIIDKLIPTNIAAITGCHIVSKGQQHSVIKKTDGSLWSWGGNTNGQLGDGTNVQSLIPTAVSGSATDWTYISSRISHTTALKSDGTLWSWGSNGSGQLGSGISLSKNTPTKVNCPAAALGIEDNEFANLKLELYPNPTNAFVNINLTDVAVNKVTIYDVYGKLVLEAKNTSQINVENLATGMYILQAFADERQFQSKFVKN
jgi:alpha-tubulin suppressor-like RCC1 family protein